MRVPHHFRSWMAPGPCWSLCFTAQGLGAWSYVAPSLCMLLPGGCSGLWGVCCTPALCHCHCHHGSCSAMSPGLLPCPGTQQLRDCSRPGPPQGSLPAPAAVELLC